jgi:predicted restriction endonuclease
MNNSQNIPLPDNFSELISAGNRTEQGMKSVYGYIVANFLSKFNEQAYNSLKFNTQDATHNKIGEVLEGIKSATIKNYRDIFDPYYGHRKGWYQSETPLTAKSVKDGFDGYSFEQYYLIVEQILKTPELTLKELFDSINEISNDKYVVSTENKNKLSEQQKYPHRNDAITEELTDSESPEYQPSMTDLRDKKFSQIILRRGQSRFRQKLGERYNYQCLITGCRLFDIVEACHIIPYMGEQDNHLDNGLLMRADLHTLFDLDFLGIEPETLIVRFHPSALQNGYGVWNETRLLCGDKTPSKEALLLRWEKFLTVQGE